jgi:Fungalysin metallopeptidase (M36)/Fungalysin/Thermolysin Propeptide Motif
MRRALVGLTVVGLLMALAAPVSAGQSPSRGLRLVQTLHSLTGTHRWYVQTYDGHDVLGSYYAVHSDKAGNVTSVADGRKAVSGVIPAAARVTADGAKTKGTVPGSVADLVVLPGKARLAWSVVDGVGVRTLVDATTGAVISRKRIAQLDTGTGRVFDPNPVVTLRDETLRDRADENYGKIKAAYRDVSLLNLDGSGYLNGDYANVSGGHGPAFSSDLRFTYSRSNAWFEQVMAYYDVTTAQRYFHSLGFTDVNNESQDMRTDTYSGDNSFYIPHLDRIVLGKGGVDDAEDAEVTWHEYGHAVQDAEVPGFGANISAGSIGEGFGDYLAVSMSQPVSQGFHLACVMDWDSTSYTSGVPHCLRKVNKDLTMADQTGEVHHDGQIWSRALWDMNQALGRTTADTIILEGQFSFTPDTSFKAAATVLVDTARTLYGDDAAQVARRAFQDRGIL